MKIEKHLCDIKGCLEESPKGSRELGLQVIFSADQTDGKTSMNPYLCNEKIDLCGKHYVHLLNGNMVFGAGCMGNNEYYFRQNKELYTELFEKE